MEDVCIWRMFLKLHTNVIRSVFCLTGNGDDWNFTESKGFLALAHPSPLYIGVGHGVYVLEDRDAEFDTG